MVVELQHNTFKNLKVFITGTSSGIGHAVSKAYLERGSIVYGIDNKNNKSLNLQFKNFEFHNCNVQNYKKMSLIVKKILFSINLFNCSICKSKSFELISNKVSLTSTSSNSL